MFSEEKRQGLCQCFSEPISAIATRFLPLRAIRQVFPELRRETKPGE